MYKTVIKGLSTLALTSLLASSALAQESQFGVGVGVASDNAALLRGTINLDNNMRLEPFFGYTYKNPDNQPSISYLELGTALHLLQPISSKINAYYGGYVGYENDEINGNGNSLFKLGPVAGVEYAFDKQFTLGAEVGLGLGFGDEIIVTTDSAVILRYYF